MDTKKKNIATLACSDFEHDFGGINVYGKRENQIAIVKKGLPYQHGESKIEINCLIDQIDRLSYSNEEKDKKQFHPARYPYRDGVSGEDLNINIEQQAILKNKNGKVFSMGRKFINKSNTVDKTQQTQQTQQVVELLNNLGIKHGSAMLTDAVALSFWPLLKEGENIYNNGIGNATNIITSDRFIIYVIDCVEMRNDPASGKGAWSAKLADPNGGVLLKFIKPSEPQILTYKWPKEEAVFNTVYGTEPDKSWFSNYEFKLLTDTDGEGCTLIIRDGSSDKVIIKDPKTENNIRTIRDFLENLYEKIYKKKNQNEFLSMFNYKIQQKRSGDWLQVLACLNVKNMEWLILDHTGKKSQDMPDITDVYFLTLDQIALAFAIDVGVSSIFTHGATHTITSFKKDSPEEERTGLINKAASVIEKLKESRIINESEIVLPNISDDSIENLNVFTSEFQNPFENVNESTDTITLTSYLDTFNGHINTILNRLYKINECTQLRDREKSRVQSLKMMIEKNISEDIKKVAQASREEPTAQAPTAQAPTAQAPTPEENKELSKAIYNVEKYLELINDTTTTRDKILAPLSGENIINVDIKADITKYFNKLSSRGTIDSMCGAFDVIHSIDNIDMITRDECDTYKTYFNSVALKVMELFSKRDAEIKKNALVISAYCREFQTRLEVICPKQDNDINMEVNNNNEIQGAVSLVEDPKKTILNVVSEINSITSTDETQSGGMYTFYNLRHRTITSPPPPPPPPPETIYNILLGDIKRRKNIRKKYINDGKISGKIKIDLIFIELLERIIEELESERHFENKSYVYEELDREKDFFLDFVNNVPQELDFVSFIDELKTKLYNMTETYEILNYISSIEKAEDQPNKMLRLNNNEKTSSSESFDLVSTLKNVNNRISEVINETGNDLIYMIENPPPPAAQQPTVFQTPPHRQVNNGYKSPQSYEKKDHNSPFKYNEKRIPLTPRKQKPYTSDGIFDTNYFDYGNIMQQLFNDNRDSLTPQGHGNTDDTVNNANETQQTDSPQRDNNLFPDEENESDGSQSGGGGAPQEHQEQLEHPEEIESIGHLYKHNRGCRVKPSESPTEVFETIVKLSSPTFENEQRILSKLVDVPFSSVLFPTIMKKEDITLGSIEDEEMKRCMESPETPYMMITRRSKGVPITEYFEELDQQENPQLTLVQLLESFIQGLKMLSSLEQHSIVHMDINENTVTYDKMNGTLALADFSMSFDKEDDTNTTDEEIFVEYDGELYWSMEVYILSMITKLEPEARQQVPTKEELDAMCMSYAEESSLKTVVDESTMAQYIEIMKTYMGDTTTGQTWEQMKASLKENMFKWDLFSLIVLCLRIIGSLSIRDSEVIHEVRQRLHEYIITRPNMMKTSKEIEEEIREKFGSVELEKIKKMDQIPAPQEEPPQEDLTQDPPQDPPQEGPPQDPQQGPPQDPQQDPPQEDPSQEDPQQDPQQDPPQDPPQDPQQDPQQDPPQDPSQEDPPQEDPQQEPPQEGPPQ